MKLVLLDQTEVSIKDIEKAKEECRIEYLKAERSMLRYKGKMNDLELAIIGCNQRIRLLKCLEG